MAKIDTGAIAGYAEMTAEEKLAALEGFEFETPKPDNSEIDKLKNIISARNSEVADYKRKWQATLDENQKAEIARQEEEANRIAQQQAIENELNALRKEKTISGYEASFLAAGYSADLAKTSATAMADGNTMQVFADLSAFIEGKTKSIQAEALNAQPKLTAGAPPSMEDIKNEQERQRLRKYAGLA